MIKQTLSEQLLDLQAGKYSSTELTKAYLDRIEAEDGTLNSYISVDREGALAQAAQADAKIRNGESLPLLGIPLAHKDIFLTAGTRTSAGSRMLDNFIAPFDATLIERCQSSGAVMLGKTNMDEFAMGSSNENSYYGPVKNPWDTTRVPGGSSGGSAAAVAAGLCSAATGTDTGGSIRQPAAFCGLTGLKPTYGRISRWGMIAFASSLDQAGPMCRSAEDAARLLAVTAGLDEKDSTSLDRPVDGYLEQLNLPLKGKRFGLCREFMDDRLDSGIQTAIMAAVEVLKNAGAEIVDISLPHTKYSIEAYYIIAPAECSANLSRFDGVRYGHRCADPTDLNDLYERSRAEGFGTEVKRRIMVGTFALSAGYYDAYYRKAQQIRQLIKQDFVNTFESVDFILGPTTPSTAFKIGEKSDDQIGMYLQDIYTIACNLAGVPAVSIPAGEKEGLPIGMQIIGNYLNEGGLLNVAHQFQQQTDWHKKLPFLSGGNNVQ